MLIYHRMMPSCQYTITHLLHFHPNILSSKQAKFLNGVKTSGISSVAVSLRTQHKDLTAKLFSPINSFRLPSEHLTLQTYWISIHHHSSNSLSLCQLVTLHQWITTMAKEQSHNKPVRNFSINNIVRNSMRVQSWAQLIVRVMVQPYQALQRRVMLIPRRVL